MRTWDRLKLDCPINAMYVTNPTQQVSQSAQKCMCGTLYMNHTSSIQSHSVLYRAGVVHVQSDNHIDYYKSHNMLYIFLGT